MSSIGTGVAAGVAQTTATAQTAARQRDKRINDKQREADKARDLFEAQLRAVEEGDEGQTPTQIQIDQNLPEHQTTPVDRKRQGFEAMHRAAVNRNEEDGDAEDGALYKHVDVKA